MASPFRLFRKHTKPLLAVFMVLLIIAWLGGGALTSYMGNAQAGKASADRDARAVAVHWDGGKLTNRELSELVYRRHVLNGFLSRVEMDGRRSAYEAGVEPRQLHVEMLAGPDTPQQGVERSVVQTKIFADTARNAGMRVSDDTIRQYLAELGRGNVSPEKMRSMLGGRESGGSGATIDLMIEALRDEMLARNYINSQQFAFQTVTPQQRWQDWLRVNDRVVVEAAAVPAESFLAEVKEPSDVEIAAFFEKYKDREAGPEIAYGSTELPSPTPGFKIPRKIDLQFVQAIYDEFLTKAEAKVTDQEVAKFYDEHKNMFEKAETPLMPESPAIKNGAKEGANKLKPEAAKKPSESDAKKSSDAAPNDKNAKSSPAQEKTTDGTKPAGDKDAKPANKDGKTESAPSKKSSYRAVPTHSPFRLTAFEQDAQKKNADADKTSASADTKSGKAAEKSVEKTDAKASAGPALTSPKTTDASKVAPPNAAPPTAKKPVQYQTLEEVKDVIRKQLAEGKVAEQLSDLTSQIQSVLKTGYDNWRFSDAAVSGGEKQALPPPPKSLTDFAPIAAKNGLKAVRTDPKSFLEIREMPIGKSSVVDSGRSLLSLLYGGHDLELYEPAATKDYDGNHYVLAKMSDTPARVPTLAEVRGEVIRAWKKQQSSELAEKHADELAKKAQESKRSLTDFFADDKTIKVIRTDPFSELTGGEAGLMGGQPQPFRLSQPEGIVAAGPAFVRRAFELKDGQVGVVFNHDHSIAYVVRVVEHQLPLPELRTTYLGEANTWPGLGTMNQMHMQEAASGLRDDIFTGANLTWDRDADKSAQDAQRDEG
jgi:hypothetical protein